MLTSRTKESYKEGREPAEDVERDVRDGRSSTFTGGGHVKQIKVSVFQTHR